VTSSPHGPAAQKTSKNISLAKYFGVFSYTRRAAELVWATSRRLTIVIGVLTLLGGLLPPALAWVAQLIIDSVLRAAETKTAVDSTAALIWVGLEGGLIIALAGVQRGIDVCNALLRARLGHRVNVMILDKALTLNLQEFEDAEFYDKMTRARREASFRPLSLVRRTFGLGQNLISLVSYAGLLVALSPVAVAVLIVAALPAFIAETKFAGEAFRLFSWRAPETRQRAYLEMLVAREDHAKEVKLFELGPVFVRRYKDIFEKVYGEDRDLTLRRGFWGFLLGLVGTTALYGAYVWIALRTIAGLLTLGQMAMYLAVFKQGQSAFSAILSGIGGMYEDNLYLSNLYEFLEQEVARPSGSATEGPDPADGVRFDEVTFTYPDATAPALNGVTLHVPPGKRLALVGHNGSGKTTLIKLLARLYEPSSGRVLVDGLDIRDWDVVTLRRRIGVIFQDFVRYQLKVGENIGAGDAPRMDDEDGWAVAADKGMAKPFVDEMPAGYHTQLGRWFKDGRELSLGQWQKVALSRAFMRQDADILVLDEPTAAMDAEAEAEIFSRLSALTDTQIAILISHRFSTVRMADDIAVLDAGRIVERGDHEALMQTNGIYARLFTLQAEGYR
jgi:ATP-binding cassette, subfamily B, bacterial